MVENTSYSNPVPEGLGALRADQLLYTAATYADLKDKTKQSLLNVLQNEKLRDVVEKYGPLVAAALFTWYEHNRASKSGLSVEEQMKQDISNGLHWIKTHMHNAVDTASSSIQTSRRSSPQEVSDQLEFHDPQVMQPQPESSFASPLPSGLMGNNAPYIQDTFAVQNPDKPKMPAPTGPIIPRRTPQRFEEEKTDYPAHYDGQLDVLAYRIKQRAKKTKDSLTNWWQEKKQNDPSFQALRRWKNRIYNRQSDTQ